MEIIDILSSLKGKSVLITGSSRGIGKALALGFANCGARVAVHGSKMSEALENTLSELKAINPGCIGVCGDLSDASAPDSIYRKTADKFGGVDILICNASLQIRKSWTEVTKEEADLQMQINLNSALMLIQLCTPYMQSKNWGRIITVGSVQQIKPHPDMLIYSASKAALVNMVQSIALQTAKDGITVNNIAPGTIFTDRNTEALSDKAYYEKIKNDIPLKIIGEPDDCVGMVLVLASDLGRYITGENIFIDGGKHI